MAFVPRRSNYLVFGSPAIGEAEVEEVLACIRSSWLGTGPRVQRFEEDMRAYLGASATVAVSSGTAALILALKMLRLEPGSEVITSPMTFCATANAIIHAGLVPVFADCERDSMNLDPTAVERKIGPRTRAIIPVHFAGRAADMTRLMAIARRYDLRVVEDCAHAIETTIDGQHVGTFGDFGCFSFYVTKNITTVEGGLVACRDPKMASGIKTLALHGMSQDAWHRFSDKGYVHYEVTEPGFKFNLTDLAASIGIHQLARVEDNHARRSALWSYYQSALAHLPLHLPFEGPKNTRHAYHLFPCLVDERRTDVKRDQVLAALHAQRIGSGVHYRALHLHRYYRETYRHAPGDFPNAEFIGDRTFSIPLSSGMSDGDVRDVVAALEQTFSS